MAQWQPKKLNVEDINDGNQYGEGIITVEDYNQTLEGIMQSNIDASTANENSIEAKATSKRAEETANGIDGKATQALEIAKQSNEKSDQAVATANEALEQVVQGQGTKVTVNGTIQSTWNSDVKADKNLTFEKVSVPTTAWTANETTTDFVFKSDIELNGVTATMSPQVNFSLTDSASGSFSNVATSFVGGVTIYASEKPTTTVEIPNIIMEVI